MTRARSSAILVPQGPPGPTGPPGPPGESGGAAFAFAVVNGNLILTYADETEPPNFQIVNGRLIHTF